MKKFQCIVRHVTGGDMSPQNIGNRFKKWFWFMPKQGKRFKHKKIKYEVEFVDENKVFIILAETIDKYTIVSDHPISSHTNKRGRV